MSMSPLRTNSTNKHFENFECMALVNTLEHRICGALEHLPTKLLILALGHMGFR